MEKCLSQSDQLRNKGNEIYKTCTDDLLFSTLKERIYKAINLYNEALKNAIEKTEAYKANKNIALSYVKLFKKGKINTKFDENMFYGFSFMECYTKCLNLAKFLLTETEKTEMIISIKEKFSELFEFIKSSNLSKEDKIERLKKFMKIPLLNNEISANINISISRMYFNFGIELFEKSCYIRGISVFNDSLMHAKQSLENKNDLYEETLDELLDLEESSSFYILKCNIYKSIDQGNKLLSGAIFEEESIEMEYLYLSLDKYREAYMLCNCSKEGSNKSDIESEAIVCSKMAVIFYRILKNNEKGEIFSKLSVELGMSLYPRNITLEKWYREASAIVIEIRKIREKEEKEKYGDEIEKLKKELAPEFSKIDKESKLSCTSFLKFIVVNYPPKENFVFDVDNELKNSNMKKVLLKLIVHYHPDKCPVEDLKKKVLMEEICKNLNNRYDYFKD